MATAVRNRVKELRATTFLGEVNQKQLAERAGIDPSTLSDIENQKSQPTVETALALARIFGCTVEDLFLPSDVAESATDSPLPAPSEASAATASTGAPGASVVGARPSDGMPVETAAGNRAGEAR